MMYLRISIGLSILFSVLFASNAAFAMAKEDANVSTHGKAEALDLSGVTGLADLRWKQRVLLLNINKNQDVSSLLNIFNGEQGELRERRLLVLFVSSNEVKALAFNDQHHPVLVQSHFSAKLLVARLQGKNSILIGLDAQDKSFYDWPNAQYEPDLSEVYRDIDAMPMRKAELR